MNDEIRRSLRSIQRRHQISIKRLDDIERRLEEAKTEASVEVSEDHGIVSWFRIHVLRIAKRGGSDDAAA